MIIAIIYILLSYGIFDQQLKTTIRNSSVPPHLKKSPSPFFLTPSLKICASGPFLPRLTIFQASTTENGPSFGGGGHYALYLRAREKS